MAARRVVRPLCFYICLISTCYFTHVCFPECRDRRCDCRRTAEGVGGYGFKQIAFSSRGAIAFVNHKTNQNILLGGNPEACRRISASEMGYEISNTFLMRVCKSRYLFCRSEHSQVISEAGEQRGGGVKVLPVSAASRIFQNVFLLPNALHSPANTRMSPIKESVIKVLTSSRHQRSHRGR